PANGLREVEPPAHPRLPRGAPRGHPFRLASEEGHPRTDGLRPHPGHVAARPRRVRPAPPRPGPPGRTLGGARERHAGVATDASRPHRVTRDVDAYSVARTPTSRRTSRVFQIS